MTIIHTPRVIGSIAKGLWKRRQQQQYPSAAAAAAAATTTTTNDSTVSSVIKPVIEGIEIPHIYKARVGLFDIDYLGHMNNAAFLSHAEYARWEMTASNGMLPSMYQTDTHYMVSLVACRYRAQIRPLFRTFQVESIVSGIDDTSLWIYQVFRNRESSGGKNNNQERIRAQVLTKGVTVHNRQVIDPRPFLITHVGIPSEKIDLISRPNPDSSMEDMIDQCERLESSYRHAASIDDERVIESQSKE